MSLLLAQAEALFLRSGHRRAFISLDQPILLPPQQIFKPTIDIENPAAFSATMALSLTFEGVLLRPAQ